MRSPCIGCSREKKDKNKGKCRVCRKPRGYVAALGPMTANVPIEMTHLAGGDMGSKHIGEDEIRFVRENLGKMSSADMAKNLQRSMPTVYRIIKIVKSAQPLPCPQATGQTITVAHEKPLETLFAGRDLLYGKLKALARLMFRRPEDQLLHLVAREVRSCERELGGIPLEQVNDVGFKEPGPR